MSKTIRLLIFSLTRWAFSFVLFLVHFLRSFWHILQNKTLVLNAAFSYIVQLFVSRFIFSHFWFLSFISRCAVSPFNNFSPSESLLWKLNFCISCAWKDWLNLNKKRRKQVLMKENKYFWTASEGEGKEK